MAGSSNPYGYDPATDTVRVSRHDLARLLLQFRIEIERANRPSPWSHMIDYDKSFERLADAVDYAYSVSPHRGAERGPDDRMRCKRTPAYEWPDYAPSNGAAIPVVRIRDSGQDSGSHYVIWGSGFGRTMCGIRLTRQDARAATGEPGCRECVREHRLASRPA